MNDEKRECSRIATNIYIHFVKESVDDATQYYLEGVAENCSLGGMFVSTAQPLPKGSIVTLNFFIGEAVEESSPITARAIVRWVQETVQPYGMGVKFVEVTGMKESDFVEWLKNLSE